MKKEEMKKISICDMTAWLVLTGILIWLILKNLGMMNTHPWTEYAPLYGVVYLVGWQIYKLGIVYRVVSNIK